jgi:hypothetical protein
MGFGHNASRSDGILDWPALVESMGARRLKAVSCLLMAAALSSGVVPALSENATIRGAGASTCSDYVRVYDAFRLSTDGELSRRATANFLQYEEWIDGYILGMETSFKGRGAQRDWDQVDIGKWISDYCQEHRSDVVANAALAMFREIRGAPL